MGQLLRVVVFLTKLRLSRRTFFSDGTVAQGQILIGNVTFGDFTISQAFSALLLCC